jgi:RND superfamily putative drug exporter
VLIVLAVPLRMLHLGQTDVGALPTSTQARQAYDAMSAGCGPGSNGPLLVTADLTKEATNNQAQLNQVKQQQANNASQQAQVQQQEQFLSSPASDPRLQTLKSDMLNTKGVSRSVSRWSTRAAPPRSTPSSQTTRRLTAGPRSLLLTIAFRSLLVPLKAIVMNVLSIAAAFGVVTYAFGHGWSAQSSASQAQFRSRRSCP